MFMDAFMLIFSRFSPLSAFACGTVCLLPSASGLLFFLLPYALIFLYCVPTTYSLSSPFYLSASPITGSMLPMTATISEIIPPFNIIGKRGEIAG